MLTSDQRRRLGLTAAAVALALLPVTADAQTTMPRGWLKRAATDEVHRVICSTAFADSARRTRQAPGNQKRSWIGRHPVLFGALVGFGSGFLIGYLPGDDGIFDDFTAGFNGWVLGGVGAGTGAAVGAIVGASTK
jgi:hypothetical protein